MRKEFDIYVDDHILKWAKKAFWYDEDPPYKISERSILGMLILGHLNDKREKKLCLSLKADSILIVELSDTLAKRSPDALKLMHLNNILEKIFKTYLQTWVDIHNEQYEIDRYKAMKLFFEYYGIEYSQKMIDRYQKYVQRAKSRSYSNYRRNKYQISL